MRLKLAETDDCTSASFVILCTSASLDVLFKYLLTLTLRIAAVIMIGLWCPHSLKDARHWEGCRTCCRLGCYSTECIVDSLWITCAPLPQICVQTHIHIHIHTMSTDIQNIHIHSMGYRYYADMDVDTPKSIHGLSVPMPIWANAGTKTRAIH